jgi:hypothetical protein
MRPFVHVSRAVSAVGMLFLAGCAGLLVGAPPVPAPTTGSDVLQRMYRTYEGRWFQTLQFTQENTRYTSNGRTERTQWKEYLLVPGRLRIEFLPAANGNGAVYADGNLYSFEGGRLAKTTPQINMLLVLTADVYGQPLTKSVEQLTSLGFDLSKVRSDTWQGRPVYVVGAASAADLQATQFWVDAQTWVVLRVIDRGNMLSPTAPRPGTEYRLSDYRTIEGVPVVHDIGFYREGALFFREQYTEVQLNTALDARLFSATQWRIAGRTP